MKLLTKELKTKLLAKGRANADAVRAGREPSDAPICKFFNPTGAATWLVCSMDEDEDTLWVIADLGMDCVEFGTASLAELQAIKGRFGLGIERDLYWKPSKTFAEYLTLSSLAGV